MTRVALVTGAARRLGAHLARRLARRGFHVLVHHRASVDGAEATVRAIADAGGSARAVAADLGDRGSIAAMFEDIRAREGRLDLLVNNVGNYEPRPLREVTPEAWDALIQVNLNGTWACCWHAERLMSRGQIITLGYAGVDALVGNAAATPYQVSKTGLLVLTKSMAQAWAPRIRANMVSPGQLENSVDLPDPASLPSGRAGTLDDVWGAVDYLLDADYVTGVNIDVAGGYHLLGTAEP